MIRLSEMAAAAAMMYLKNPEYGATLCGPRTRGSTTKLSLFNQSDLSIYLAVKDREIYEVTPPEGTSEPGCKYYQCKIHELLGIQKAISLKAARDLGLVVLLNHGKHGYELIAHGAQDQPTDTVSFVVGPAGELFTWYPGEILGSCDHGVNDMTGVKLV